jgi:hypothetical protein
MKLAREQLQPISGRSPAVNVGTENVIASKTPSEIHAPTNWQVNCKTYSKSLPFPTTTNHCN